MILYEEGVIVDKIRFGVIGAGWRSEFFIKTAAMLPDVFQVSGVLLRDSLKAKAFSQKWKVKTFLDLEEFLKARPEFVITAVSSDAAFDYNVELIKRGVATLSETPPGKDEEALKELWRVYKSYNTKFQVAEQYFLQPMWSAVMNIIQSELIGNVIGANISACHGYHGINLIRRILNIPIGNTLITGKRLRGNIISTCGRNGDEKTEKFINSSRDAAILQFENGKWGIFDFEGEQYFSHIRSRRWTIYGDRGEISDTTVRYLKAINTPVKLNIDRIDTGINSNLEGYHHKCIMLGERKVYENQFAGVSFSDDEIAVAHCIWLMGQYVRGEIESFYSLEEAIHDSYLSLKLNEALEKDIPQSCQPLTKH